MNLQTWHSSTPCVDGVQKLRQNPGVESSELVPPMLEPKPRRPLWRRFLKWFLWVVGSLFGLLLVLAVLGWWMWGSGRIMKWMMIHGATDTEATAPSERPWPPTGTPPGVQPADTWPGPRERLNGVGSAAAFYRGTNIWEVELAFTGDEWEELQPKANPPGVNIADPPTKFPLRNPAAARNGLAGVLGLSQPWSTARVLVGGQEFTNVSVRLKGNGTFVGSLATYKRPFKVDFGRKANGRRIAGFQVLNLNNLIADFSGVSDAMGYGFYRRAGVPAPRTAFGRFLLAVEGKFARRPLGLYALVENLDDEWAREVFGGREVVLFKPVTYELFADLGTNWSVYEGIYDPKNPVTVAHQFRVMETARFVSRTSDTEFNARVGEFFDLPEVARFVAVTSLLSSYDGFLSNGQNFVMYLDAASGRLGFIPWDLDQAWGSFPLIGTRRERETASIRRPWVADHRLLERLFASPSFRALYLREFERIFREQFDVARLAAEARLLATLVRPTVLEESDYRVDRFDRTHAETWPEEEPEPKISDPMRPVHRVHRFLIRRAESVEAQLAGRETGHEFRTRQNLMQQAPPPNPGSNSAAGVKR